MPRCLRHRSIDGATGGGIAVDTSCFAVDTIAVSISGDIDAGTDFVYASYSRVSCVSWIIFSAIKESIDETTRTVAKEFCKGN